MMNAVRLLRGLLRGERGAVLVMAAAGMVAMIGAATLSVDVGYLLYQRRAVQNAVDAAAHAGSLRLPSNPGAAATDAVAWAARNGVPAGQVTVTISSTLAGNDTISVSARREVPFFLAPVLGQNQAPVTARAKVVVGSYVGGTGAVPWGLLARGECFDNAGRPIYGRSCRLKMGSLDGGVFNGEFGALEVDGPGAADYRDDIASGANRSVRIGDALLPKAGNMQGPTRQGIEDRLLGEPTAGCDDDGDGRDDAEEVFSLGLDGAYGVECDDSPRAILVPIIDGISQDRPSVVIDFALMYLEDYNFQGGQTEVLARLMRVNVHSASAIVGAYRDNGLRIIRLTE